MKFVNTSLLIFGLILTFVSCLKLPTPSPTVLIVNHLNYLRYDYAANPTSLRPNGYPFYETTAHLNAHLNRSFNENAYSLNRTANPLNGLINLEELDNQLNGRLDQQLSNQLNDRLENHLNNQLNNQLASQSNDRNIDQPDQIGEEHHQDASQPNGDPSVSLITESVQLNDLNNNPVSNPVLNSVSNEEINQQLNHLTINDQLDDLILTNHSSHQARLLELDLLQQNEPSLSLVLDADSPFLNSVQTSDAIVRVGSSEQSNDQQSIISRPANSTFNEFLFDEPLLNDSPAFDLLNYSPIDDELNLNSLNISYTPDSDLHLPANIDDIALGLISNGTSFLNSNPTAYLASHEEQPAIDFSPFLNSNRSDETLYERNHKLTDSAEATTSQATSSQAIGRTISPPDSYISEILSDEDLQMIGFPNQTNLLGLIDDFETSPLIGELDDDLGRTKATDEHADECDSAIESMPSPSTFSGSDNSSHFDNQFMAKKERKLRSRCSTSSNDMAFFDGFEMNDTNYCLYPREEDVFDPILLDDGASRISFTDISQDVVINNNENVLHGVLHNHTYVPLADQKERSSSASSSASSSKPHQSKATSSRTQVGRPTDSERNRRLLDESAARQLNFDMMSVTSETSSMTEEERSLSRDERKAKDLQLPISVCEIINMPIDEFNECLSKYDLNEQQLTLVKDIRRRGKNKVAAQNCRKRKINQIVGLQHEVDHLQSQKGDLLSYYDKLFAIRDLAQSKYQKLYDYVYERSQTNAALLANFELNFRSAKRNNSDEIGAVGGLNDTSNFDENNTNRLNEMRPPAGDMLKNLTMDIKPKVQSNYKKALAMN